MMQSKNITMGSFGGLFLTLLLLVGCTPLTNIKSYLNEDYYTNQANNSKNVKELKRFLSENNISIYIIGVADNQPQGALESYNFTSINITNWLKQNIHRIMFFALKPAMYAEAQFKFNSYEKIMVLSICGDYTHAAVSQNLQSLTVRFKYMLSQMALLERQELYTPKWLDCSGTAFGEVIYQKDITVSASLDSIKMGYELINVSGGLSAHDKMTVLAYDVMEKANIILLDDAELLQAWKNYQLTKSTSKTTSVNLDEFKAQCKELGFKVGTQDFGNCVLQLNEGK